MKQHTTEINIVTKQNFTKVVSKIQDSLKKLGSDMKQLASETKVAIDAMSNTGSAAKAIKHVSTSTKEATENMGLLLRKTNLVVTKMHNLESRSIKDIGLSRGKRRSTENPYGFTSAEMETHNKYSEISKQNLDRLKESKKEVTSIAAKLMQERHTHQSILNLNTSNKNLLSQLSNKYRTILGLKRQLSRIPIVNTSAAPLQAKLANSIKQSRKMFSKIGTEEAASIRKSFDTQYARNNLVKLETQYKEILRLTKQIGVYSLKGLHAPTTLTGRLSTLTKGIKRTLTKAQSASKSTAEKIKNTFDQEFKQINTDILVQRQESANRKMVDNLRNTLKQQERLLAGYDKKAELFNLSSAGKAHAMVLFSSYQKNMNRAVKSGVIGTDEASASLDRYNKRFSLTGLLLSKNTGILNEWWQRFGVIALGFTIMYRAMNAIEFVIRGVVTEIGKGIQAFDSLQEAAIREAMFFAIFNRTLHGWTQALQSARISVQAMQAASVNAFSSIDDLNQGLSEFAMHGFFVPPSMMKQFVNFIDFVNLVATTTGSTSKQVKQEVASMFTGVVKVSDSTMRFIRNFLSPTQFKQLQDQLKYSRNVAFNIKKIFSAISFAMTKAKAAMRKSDFVFMLKVTAKQFDQVVIQAMRLAAVMDGLKKQGENIFAMTLQKSFAKTGIDQFKKLEQLKRVILAAPFKQRGNLIKEYTVNLNKYLGTPMGKLNIQLAVLFKQLSKLIPFAINFAATLVPAITMITTTINSFILKNAKLLSSLWKVILTIIKLKTTLLVINIILGSTLMPAIGLVTLLITKLGGAIKALAEIKIFSKATFGISAFLSANATLISIAILLVGGIVAVFVDNTKLFEHAIKNFFNPNFMRLQADKFLIELDRAYSSFPKFLQSILYKLNPFSSLSPVMGKVSKFFASEYGGTIANLKEDIKNTNKKLKAKHYVPTNFFTTFKKGLYHLVSSTTNFISSSLSKMFNFDKYLSVAKKRSEKASINAARWFKLFYHTIKKPINRLTQLQLTISGFKKGLSASFKDLNVFNISGLRSYSHIEGMYDTLIASIYKYIKAQKDLALATTDVTKKARFDSNMKVAENSLKAVRLVYSKKIGALLKYNLSLISAQSKLKQTENKYSYKMLNKTNPQYLTKELSIVRAKIESITKLGELLRVSNKASINNAASVALQSAKINAELKEITISDQLNAIYTHRLSLQAQLYTLNMANAKLNKNKGVFNLEHAKLVITDIKEQLNLEKQLSVATGKNKRLTLQIKIMSIKNKLYKLTHAAHKALTSLQQIAKTVAQSMQHSFSSLFFDAMQGKLKTLKSYFMSFAASVEQTISQMLAKMMIKFAMVQLFGKVATAAILPSAKGNVFTNGVKAFATGGLIEQPTIFPMANGGIGLAGEAGTEAILPLGRNSKGELGVKAQSSNNNIQLNIVNTVDPNLVGQYLASPSGENTILNVIQKHSYTIKRSLQLV